MQTSKTRPRRTTRLAFALAAAGILAGLVFAPAASAATGDFIISGRGNGQGQGLSQWGMWQGARLGNTYQQILAFYYPGTTLTTISAVAPTRETITVRITTGVDTFASVKLTAAATAATLVDSTGATISSLAVGDSVTLVYNGSKVQVSGSDTTYTYVDLKPDSESGRVTVTPSDMAAWSKARSYWGYIRVKSDSASSQVYVHNIVPIDKFVAGVSEISPDWAVPGSASYYAPEAVKAQDVAARTYIAAHSSSVPYDDSRDMNYVGYNFEASYPYATQAAQETAGVVLTYGGKLIATHFSGHSGGYTTNSYWSDTGGAAYEPAQADPWSLAAPPTNPGYAWTVTVSPAALADKLKSHLNVGTITQVDVVERDTSDPTSHARYLLVTGSSGTAKIAARDFDAHVGLRSTLILSVIKDGSLNHYEQNDDNLAYAGNWTVFSTSGASGGSYRRANTGGASVTVTFDGTYLEWIATKGTTLGKALVSLDGADGPAGQPRRFDCGLSAECLEHRHAFFGRACRHDLLGSEQLRREICKRRRIQCRREPASGTPSTPSTCLEPLRAEQRQSVLSGHVDRDDRHRGLRRQFPLHGRKRVVHDQFRRHLSGLAGQEEPGVRQSRGVRGRREQRNGGPIRRQRDVREGLGHGDAAIRTAHRHHRVDGQEFSIHAARLQYLRRCVRHPGYHRSGAAPLPAGHCRAGLHRLLGKVHGCRRVRGQLLQV